MVRVFAIPIPVIFAAMAVAEPGQLKGPDWLLGASSTAFVILWFLNTIGKLPGGSTERRAGGEQLAELHRIMTREDKDKPGWYMAWGPSYAETREMRDGLQNLSRLADAWLEDRKTWAHEKDELERRIARLEEIRAP